MVLELNKIYKGHCLELFPLLDENSIDCIITSPPYNVGIEYDVWDDNMQLDHYRNFVIMWLLECRRVLKDDGRIAINVLYEANMHEHGGRLSPFAEFYDIMVKTVGLQYNGMIDLNEISPQKSRLSAWGSWLSASSPYIYNPKECVILGCKSQWKKKDKGISYFDQTNEKKAEFIKCCNGVWDYRAETKGLTKANFSLSLPSGLIKILTYENDIVLDPFMGSGTTAMAARDLNRNWIGFELSQEYINVANKRLFDAIMQETLF